MSYQQYVVGLGGLTLLSSCFPGSESNSRASTILQLHQLVVAATMSQPINQTLDVRIEASRIDLSLAQENYVFLMEMVAAIIDNLQGLTAKSTEVQAQPTQQQQISHSSPAIDSTSSLSSSSSTSDAIIADSSSVSAPSSSWIRVGVCLRHLSVQLLKSKGWNATDGLLALVARDADVRFSMDTTGPGGMSVDTAWESIEVIDETVGEDNAAPVLDEFRRMIGMREPTAAPIERMYNSAFHSSRGAIRPCDLTLLSSAHLAHSPPPVGALSVQWSQGASGAQEISVLLGHFYYCTSSMVVLEMASFFVLPPSSSPSSSPSVEVTATKARHHDRHLYGRGTANDDIDARLALMADPLVTGSFVPPKPATAATGPEITVKLRMPAAVIQLIASGAAADARGLAVALDLTVDFGMGGGRMQTSLQLDRLRSVETSGAVGTRGIAMIDDAERAQQVYIIRPTDLHVAFLSEPSRLFLGDTAITVQVGIEQMKVNVGVQQYLFVMHALDRLFPKPPPATATPPKEEAAEQPTPSSSADTHAASDVSSGPSAPAGGLRDVLHFSEQNLHVQIGSVEVNIVNDCYHNPMYLLRLTLSRLLAKVHRFGDSGGLYARAGLSADFYNHRVTCWEPVVEPWEIVATHHASCNTHTPQEYLLTHQPSRRHHQIVGGLTSETDGESMTASSSGSSRSLTLGAITADSDMSPEEVRSALMPFTEIHLNSSQPFNLNLSVAAIEDLVDFARLIQDATIKPTHDVKFVRHRRRRTRAHARRRDRQRMRSMDRTVHGSTQPVFFPCV